MKQLITNGIGSFINLTAVLFPKWSASFAFELLCKVKRVGISEKGKNFFTQATSVSLENGNHDTVLHQWGTGATKLLFLHGWMSNSQRWEPYVAQLDLKEYSVYALDAPGHGMAKGNKLNLEVYRQGVAKAIDHIGSIDTLVCHSLGSLVGSYAYLANTEIPIDKFAIMGAPSGMDAIFVYFKDMLGLSSTAMHNLKTKIDTILRLPTEAISMEHFFQKVNKPVLVIHEVSDNITPFQRIKEASAVNTDIETFFTNGQDHNLTGRETVNNVIQFIKR